MVNTSFNMHEEPIVATADDAIRTFLQGGLDYLALDRFLISRPS
jgi:carbamoyltransferase